MIYVDDDAPNDPGPGDPAVSDPDEDGSAEHPFDAIQEGLDAAQDGDEVEVADGTYTGQGNRDLDFAGKAIMLRSQNGPDTCVIDCDNSGRGFFFHAGESEASVVDGFTIQKGRAPGLGPGVRAGGGVYCQDSSPTIINCTIRWNLAKAYGGYGYEGYSYGGGIYCDNSSPTISNCTITQNEALGTHSDDSAYGGGVYCRAGSSPTITGCTIAGNEVRARDEWYAASGGAGIYCDNSSPTVSGCTITGNRAGEGASKGSYDYGAGVCSEYGGSPSISGCTIAANVAQDDGGGIYCYQSSPIITACTITENEVESGQGGSGGGVYCYDSSPTIAECVVTANSVEYAGGGIYCYNSSPLIANCLIRANTGYIDHGGGICCEWYSSPVITNCTITENTGSYGGGIACRVESSPTIANCAIADNSAGVYSHFYSSPTIANCTLTENGYGVYSTWESSPEIAGSVLWGNGLEIKLRELAGYPSYLAVSYSDVQGGQAAAEIDEGCTLDWGAGNIDADPLLADPDSGDYHLSAGSPCIDTGDPDFVAQPGESDMDGELRVWDGDDDGAAVVDMGADEFGSFVYGDLNCDGVANGYDIDPFILAVMSDPPEYVEYYAEYPDCEIMLADVDGSGHVDGFDIDPFVELLLGE